MKKVGRPAGGQTGLGRSSDCREEPGLLRGLTLNVDGIRDPGKYLASENFVTQERPDISVLTERHLTREEARNLVLKTT